MPDTHEYRLAITVPLSGSDREQSAHKAAIHPLIDALEEGIKALGLSVTIEDGTVKLGRGKQAKVAVVARAAECTAASARAKGNRPTCRSCRAKKSGGVLPRRVAVRPVAEESS